MEINFVHNRRESTNWKELKQFPYTKTVKVHSDQAYHRTQNNSNLTGKFYCKKLNFFIIFILNFLFKNNDLRQLIMTYLHILVSSFISRINEIFIISLSSRISLRTVYILKNYNYCLLFLFRKSNFYSLNEKNVCFLCKEIHSRLISLYRTLSHHVFFVKKSNPVLILYKVYLLVKVTFNSKHKLFI